MAKFCNHCGSPLENGEVCTCSQLQSTGGNSDSIIEIIKNRLNPREVVSPSVLYERDKKVVPDCVLPDEGEIPLRQYNVAHLRSRIKFQKAEGRLQVNNKRVLFRAKGTSLPGNTLLQYEFEIGELAGIEARRDYKFSFLNLILSSFIASLGIVIMGLLLSSFKDGDAQKAFGHIFAIAGIVPFFMLKDDKRWLKLLSLRTCLKSPQYYREESQFNHIQSIYK